MIGRFQIPSCNSRWKSNDGIGNQLQGRFQNGIRKIIGIGLEGVKKEGTKSKKDNISNILKRILEEFMKKIKKIL